MAASVRIEDEAFSDERYEVLATLCQLADSDHARGKMARIWRQCTAQKKYVLPGSMVVAVLGENGPNALAESCLGEVVEGGIRIRGTKGRIEWLAKLRKNASKGGVAKRASRQSRGKQEPAIVAPPPCPPTPTPTPTPSGDTESDQRSAVPATALRPSGLSRKSGSRPAPDPDQASAEITSSDHARAIAEFHERYLAKYGTKPAWGATEAVRIKRLLKKLGLDELVTRIRILFDSPPRFLADSPPDVATLEQHINKLSRPANVQRTPLELQLERVRMLEAEERAAHDQS